jgi:Ca2+-binding RTX toxin-like protein
VARGGKVVLEDGSVHAVAAEHIVYSEKTRHLYEEAEEFIYTSEGGEESRPQVKQGWRTYNFEVEEFHTYIAEGVRVHSDSLQNYLNLSVMMKNDSYVAVAFDDMKAEFNGTAAFAAAAYSDAGFASPNRGSHLGGMVGAYADALAAGDFKTAEAIRGGLENTLDTGIAPAERAAREALAANLDSTAARAMQGHVDNYAGARQDYEGALSEMDQKAREVASTPQADAPSQPGSPNSEDHENQKSGGENLSVGGPEENKDEKTKEPIVTRIGGATLTLYPDGRTVSKTSSGKKKTFATFDGDDVLELGEAVTLNDGTRREEIKTALAGGGMQEVTANFGVGGELLSEEVRHRSILRLDYKRQPDNSQYLREYNETGALALQMASEADGSGWSWEYSSGEASAWRSKKIFYSAPKTTTHLVLTYKDGVTEVQSFERSHVLNAAYSRLTLLSEALEGIGNANNNRMLGNALGNAMRGAEGRDRIEGGDGADTVSGGEGRDKLYGQSGDDLLKGDEGGDRLLGEEGNDTIQGGDGNDKLRGGNGADKLIGQDGNDHLRGQQDNDTLQGGAENDTLFGDDGSDSLYGGLGNDKLHGGADVDFLDGGEGSDTLEGGGGADKLHGGAGDDVLDGNNGDDVLSGGDGNDLLSGGNWDDRLFGDAGSDTLIGGEGFDFLNGDADDDSLDGGLDGDELHGGGGSDTLSGGGGMDRLIGGAGNDIIDGGTDDDTLLGEEDDDRLSGGAGNDTMRGGTGRDTLSGGDGGDWMIGGACSDILDGGNGSDFLLGEDHSDSIDGGGGDDTALGGTGNDTINGGDGEDQLQGGIGNDVVHGNGDRDNLRGEGGEDHLYGDEGDDALWGGDDNDSLWGGIGNDALIGDSGKDSLEGEAGNDTLKGGDGEDRLIGGAGDDFLTGGKHQDFLDGGDGDDHLYGDGGGDNLNAGAGSDQAWGGDGDDSIDGGDGNDVLSGGIGNDMLVGGLGDDMLTGGEGNDTLYGGGGNDQLFGAAGDDRLIGGPDVDFIDGGKGEDTIVLTGNRNDYEIRFNTAIGRFTIVDKRSGPLSDGTDLADIEWFEFAGHKISKATLGYMTNTDDNIAWDVVNSDGSKTRLGWEDDPLNVGELHTFIERLNLKGEVVSRTEFKFDGSRRAHAWDRSAEGKGEKWFYYLQEYDTNGELIRQTNHNDDKTFTVLEWDPYEYDPIKNNVWYYRTTCQTSEAEGRLDFFRKEWLREEHMLQGVIAYIEYEWDRKGQTWDTKLRHVDEGNNTLWEVITYDDGSYTVVGTDWSLDGFNYEEQEGRVPREKDPSLGEWSSLLEVYNSAKLKTDEEYWYYGSNIDPGKGIKKTWDVANAEDWARQEWTYLGSKNDHKIARYEIAYDRHDTLSKVVKLWDYSGGAHWSTQEEQFDKAERLVRRDEQWLADGVLRKGETIEWSYDVPAHPDHKSYHGYYSTINGVITFTQQEWWYKNGQYAVKKYDAELGNSEYQDLYQRWTFEGSNVLLEERRLTDENTYRVYIADPEISLTEHLHDTWYTDVTQVSKISEYILYDSGKRYEAEYDVYGNTSEYAVYIEGYADHAGTIWTRKEWIHDDNTSLIMTRDRPSDANWDERTVKKDAKGRTYYSETKFDTVDGLAKVEIHEWDYSTKPDWIEKTTTKYNGSTISEIETIYSATHKTVEAWDTSTKKDDWSSRKKTYDNNVLDTIETVFDEGMDPGEEAKWLSTTDTLDTSGQNWTWQRIKYADAKFTEKIFTYIKYDNRQGYIEQVDPNNKYDYRKIEVYIGSNDHSYLGKTWYDNGENKNEYWVDRWERQGSGWIHYQDRYRSEGASSPYLSGTDYDSGYRTPIANPFGENLTMFGPRSLFAPSKLSLAGSLAPLLADL